MGDLSLFYVTVISFQEDWGFICVAKLFFVWRNKARLDFIVIQPFLKRMKQRVFIPETETKKEKKIRS